MQSGTFSTLPAAVARQWAGGSSQAYSAYGDLLYPRENLAQIMQVETLQPQNIHYTLHAISWALMARDRQGCGCAATLEHKLPPCTRHNMLMGSNNIRKQCESLCHTQIPLLDLVSD